MTPWNYDLEAGKTGEMVWLGIEGLTWAVKSVWHYGRWCHANGASMPGTVLAFARIEPAPAWPPSERALDQTKFWTFAYRNHRGETNIRQAVLLGVRFGSTEWHPHPQWLLRGFDIAKQAEREFAMDSILTSPPSERADPAPASDVARAIKIVEAKQIEWLSACSDVQRFAADVLAAVRTASEGERT